MVRSPKIKGRNGEPDLNIPEASGMPLVPDAQVPPRRRPGRLKGQIWMADDFDTWPDGFLDEMEAPIFPYEPKPPEEKGGS